MKSTLNKGFTLVEMSIVMLILALLTGGILIGKEVIHTAELRATLKQLETFNLAYNTFQLKYNCLPGDCSNAYELGFSGGFYIQLSQNALPQSEDDLLQYVNPISTAYALTIPSVKMYVFTVKEATPDASGAGNMNGGPGKTNGMSGNNSSGGGGGGGSFGGPVFNMGGGGGSTSGGSSGGGGGGGSTSGVNSGNNTNKGVPLNGNGNCLIENNSSNSLLEGLVSARLLKDSNMIPELDYDQTRVYLDLSSAFATIGNKTYPAFWAIGYLTPGTDGKDYIVKNPGNYAQTAATLTPFNAGTLAASDAAYLDAKGDDGRPLTGNVVASSTAQVNLINGPTFKAARDVSSTKCITADTDGSLIYNYTSNAVTSRCAQVTKLSIGGACGG